MENLWLRRYALLTAVCTFLLVVAGGLVTSNDAALSIPDWPLSWGKLIPPLEGGIRYEFAHRVLAAVVFLLTAGLALWTRSRLAWSAFAAVLAQAILGGMAVRLVAPKALVVGHACLAQLCFGLVVAVAVRSWRSAERPSAKSAPLFAAATALFAQTVLGAAVRHGVSGVVPHAVGAGVAVILVMWAALPVFIETPGNARMRRSAAALLTLTFCQVFLGVAAYASRLASAGDIQPGTQMVAFTVAHVAVGSLAFGAAVVSAVIFGQPRVEAELGHGGMAVA